MNEKSCVGNGRLFYFNYDGKLGLLSIQKKRLPLKRRNNYDIFIEYTELN